ncbi:MAG: TIR domain-containing protein [Bacteroidetes bacterium]|nr:TIR domain-containing protein [Bacteroidota bacterium]
MAEIFISYSRKDSTQADELVEQLTSAGIEVWIDRTSIEASASWSAEISRAIVASRVVIVLLSTASVRSENVSKEVALAAEHRKGILPIQLEPANMPDDLAYHLAGIQRIPLNDATGIARGLSKLGLTIGDINTFVVRSKQDSRMSLMILPFDDLTPTSEAAWLADGLCSELISRLSRLPEVRVVDWNTTQHFKGSRVKTVDLARELAVRYFVQGQVRTLGNTLKVTVMMLDIRSGDHIWSESLRGSISDLFAIEDEVAERVVDGLRLVISEVERRALEARPTQNAEAYELYLRARECSQPMTRDGHEAAVSLLGRAVELDPSFAEGHLELAATIIRLYSLHEQGQDVLRTARAHIERAASIVGPTSDVSELRSLLAQMERDGNTALEHALESVRRDPENFAAYQSLALAYRSLGRLEESAQAWTTAADLNPDKAELSNRVAVAYYELGDRERMRDASKRAIPVFEAHLRSHPDDWGSRVDYITLLEWAGHEERALEEAENVEAMEELDPRTLFNIACVYIHIGHTDRAFRALRRSINRGLRTIGWVTELPDFDPVRNTPEFEAILDELRGRIAEETSSD